MNKIIIVSVLALSYALFSGCTPSESTETAPIADSTTLPASILLTERPENPITVTQARSIDPGNPIVVEGLIGGVVHPFTEGYASFVLSDDAILFCNEMGDDHCATPWDACCEDIDTLKAGRASVQFLTANGLPYPEGMKGWNDLTELSNVVVSGEVALSSTPENLIINATGIFQN